MNSSASQAKKESVQHQTVLVGDEAKKLDTILKQVESLNKKMSSYEKELAVMEENKSDNTYQNTSGSANNYHYQRGTRPSFRRGNFRGNRGASRGNFRGQNSKNSFRPDLNGKGSL